MNKVEVNEKPKRQRSPRPRTRHRNGDSIDLACGCNSCSPSMINGVLCHESGCPDAWKDHPKECRCCGRKFYSPRRDALFCGGCD